MRDHLDPGSTVMETVSLTAVAEDLLAKARTVPAGRSARTIHGGHEHALRQTVIALTAGHALGEHESPGEATLQALSGRVRLSAGDHEQELVGGDHAVIPDARHDLTAIEDSVVILTVALASLT